MGEKEYKRNALPSSSFPSSYLSAPAALEKKKKEKLRRDRPALHPLGTQSARCTTTVITVKLSTRQGSVSLPAPLSLFLSLSLFLKRWTHSSIFPPRKSYPSCAAACWNGETLSCAVMQIWPYRRQASAYFWARPSPLGVGGAGEWEFSQGERGKEG